MVAHDLGEGAKMASGMSGRRNVLFATRVAIAAVVAALALVQPAVAQSPSATQDQYQQPGLEPGGTLTPPGSPFDAGASERKPIVVSSDVGAAIAGEDSLPFTGSDLLLLALIGAGLLSIGLLLTAGDRARRRLVARHAG